MTNDVINAVGGQITSQESGSAKFTPVSVRAGAELADVTAKLTMRSMDFGVQYPGGSSSAGLGWQIEIRKVLAVKDSVISGMSIYDLQDLGNTFQYAGIRNGGLKLAWSNMAGAYTYCTSIACGFVYADSLVK